MTPKKMWFIQLGMEVPRGAKEWVVTEFVQYGEHSDRGHVLLSGEVFTEMVLVTTGPDELTEIEVEFNEPLKAELIGLTVNMVPQLNEMIGKTWKEFRVVADHLRSPLRTIT